METSNDNVAKFVNNRNSSMSKIQRGLKTTVASKAANPESDKNGSMLSPSLAPATDDKTIDDLGAENMFAAEQPEEDLRNSVDTYEDDAIAAHQNDAFMDNLKTGIVLGGLLLASYGVYRLNKSKKFK